MKHTHIIQINPNERNRDFVGRLLEAIHSLKLSGIPARWSYRADTGEEWWSIENTRYKLRVVDFDKFTNEDMERIVFESKRMAEFRGTDLFKSMEGHLKVNALWEIQDENGNVIFNVSGKLIDVLMRVTETYSIGKVTKIDYISIDEVRTKKDLQRQEALSKISQSDREILGLTDLGK